MTDKPKPCRYAGAGQRRAIRDEHLRDCVTSGCPGCKPCPENHCASCGHRHLKPSEALTCATCVGEVRKDLALIEQMADRMLGEALHRGINSEAAMLAGPSADPSEWQRQASAAMLGRSAADYLEDCRDELHPLWVLGTWEMLWREHLDHSTAEPLTIRLAVSYLDLQLTYMAQQLEPDFDQFAGEVRQCRGHLEDVLRDGVRRETGTRCPLCGEADLEKRYAPTVLVAHRCHCGTEVEAASRAAHCPNPWCWSVVAPQPVWVSDEGEDRWVCPRRDCSASYTEQDYRTKVDAVYVLHAEALTASQIRDTYRVPEGTVRRWASDGLVRKRGRDALGRQLYDVSDVTRQRESYVPKPRRTKSA